MTAKQFEEMFPSLANAEAFTVGGRRFVSMDKVLEIIDEMEHDTGHVALIGDDNKFIGVLCNSSEFRDRVLALKGGEQE